MARLDEEARRKVELAELTADALMAEVLEAGSKRIDTAILAIEVGEALASKSKSQDLTILVEAKLNAGIASHVKKRHPFHWPLEFPEVFRRENGGFDAFVGNPPFLGGQMLSGVFGVPYQAYLVNFVTYQDKSSVDLVVFFFLRLFGLLRTGGYMGLLARRSISEGRNREAGLTQLIVRGANIYCANTNLIWPGKASVIVHQIQIAKRDWTGTRLLNKLAVDTISADLSDVEFWEAQPMKENLDRIFQGTILLGEGFKINEGTARAWIEEDVRNEQILYPFIGGNEANNSPTAEPQCWVITFWDWPEEKAALFSAPYEVVKSTVKPVRDKNKRKARREKWWIYGETAAGLYRAIGQDRHFSQASKGKHKVRSPLQRVLAISTGVSKFPAFTFLRGSYIFSNKLCVLADERFAMFAMLTSDVHGVWSWAQKTSMGGDLYSLVYAHGNIFETFPFPADFLSHGDEALESLGRKFFEARQSLMEKYAIGLTDFYNLFHELSESGLAIGELRQLQKELNKDVCRRYDWDDIELDTGFHEVGYLPEGNNIRYTISEKARLEVIRRLSTLNKDRFNEEKQSAAGEKKPLKRGRPKA